MYIIYLLGFTFARYQISCSVFKIYCGYSHLYYINYQQLCFISMVCIWVCRYYYTTVALISPASYVSYCCHWGLGKSGKWSRGAPHNPTSSPGFGKTDSHKRRACPWGGAWSVCWNFCIEISRRPKPAKQWHLVKQSNLMYRDPYYIESPRRPFCIGFFFFGFLHHWCFTVLIQGMVYRKVTNVTLKKLLRFFCENEQNLFFFSLTMKIKNFF